MSAALREMTPKEHYIIAKPMALRDLSDVRPIAEGAYRRAQGVEGYRGLFSTVRGGRPSTVGLWTFERGR